MTDDRPITEADEAAIAAALEGARTAGKSDMDVVRAVKAALVERGFDVADAWGIAYVRVHGEPVFPQLLRRITADAYRCGDPGGEDMYLETDAEFLKVAGVEPELADGKVILHVWDTGPDGRWRHGPHRRVAVAPAAVIEIVAA